MKFQRQHKKCRFIRSAGKNRIWMLLAAFVMACSMMLLPVVSVKAAGDTITVSDVKTDSYYRPDTGETGSVTLKYPVSGAEFSIYKVGVSNEEGGYTLEEPYSEYGVNLTSSSAAAVLAEYITRDSEDIDPLETVTTDDDGIAYFDDLHRGVYLILGGTITEGKWTYTASPVLFELPNLETIETGSNNYEEIWDLTIEGKYEKKETTTPEEETTELTVLKVWKSDTETNRPESIVMQLLCDGELSDLDDAEVSLTKEDDWTYTWTDLSTEHEWTVVEKTVPDGYTVSMSQDGTIIVLTNTKTNPDTPSTPSTSTSSKSSGKLPQTGQLWWPVTVLIAGGLFLVLMGLLLGRKR